MGVAGRRCRGCCPGCRWWCLIANVVEGACRVSPVPPGHRVSWAVAGGV